MKKLIRARLAEVERRRALSDPTPADAALAVDAASGKVAVAFYDRRLSCPSAGSNDATRAGLAFDPNQPYDAANYCINTALQVYTPTLQPIGQNIRLSAHSWDPQLNAPHPSCICSRRAFIGDYFGLDSNGSDFYSSSVSTFDYAGENPSNYQQQIIARIPIP